MKFSGLNLIIGFILGITASFATAAIFLPHVMITEFESKLDFDQTVETIQSQALKSGWKIPHVYDLQETMKKHSFEVEPVKVISMCQPNHAYKILDSDSDKLYSAMMPCRVSIYKKGEKTYVSMLNSRFFSKFMGDNASRVMGAASKENIEILSEVVK